MFSVVRNAAYRRGYQILCRGIQSSATELEQLVAKFSPKDQPLADPILVEGRKIYVLDGRNHSWQLEQQLQRKAAEKLFAFFEWGLFTNRRFKIECPMPWLENRRELPKGYHLGGADPRLEFPMQEAALHACLYSSSFPSAPAGCYSQLETAIYDKLVAIAERPDLGALWKDFSVQAKREEMQMADVAITKIELMEEILKEPMQNLAPNPFISSRNESWHWLWNTLLFGGQNLVPWQELTTALTHFFIQELRTYTAYPDTKGVFERYLDSPYNEEAIEDFGFSCMVDARAQALTEIMFLDGTRIPDELVAVTLIPSPWHIAPPQEPGKATQLSWVESPILAKTHAVVMAKLQKA